MINFKIITISMIAIIVKNNSCYSKSHNYSNRNMVISTQFGRSFQGRSSPSSGISSLEFCL